MKKLLIFALTLFLSFTLYAQEEEKEKPDQLFLIHRDEVDVSAVDRYKKAIEADNKSSAEYGATRPWFCSWQEDGSYLFTTPVKDWADVSNVMDDGNRPDSIDAAISEMYDGCYRSHETYLATLRGDISFGEGPPEGSNYRTWLYLYFEQSKLEEMQQVFEDWKAAFEEAGLDPDEQGYWVFTAGFGHEGPLVVIVDWAKDPADRAAKDVIWKEALGDKAVELWARTSSLVYKRDFKAGWYIPELSYIPPTAGE